MRIIYFFLSNRNLHLENVWAYEEVFDINIPIDRISSLKDVILCEKNINCEFCF